MKDPYKNLSKPPIKNLINADCCLPKGGKSPPLKSQYTWSPIAIAISGLLLMPSSNIFCLKTKGLKNSLPPKDVPSPPPAQVNAIILRLFTSSFLFGRVFNGQSDSNISSLEARERE